MGSEKALCLDIRTNSIGWVLKEWHEVLSIINGKNQKAVENPDGEYPIYGSGGIMNYADEYLCPENSTIVGRKGTINKPILVREKFWNVDTAFGLVAGEELDSFYLNYFCQSFDFSTLNKSTTLPSLAKRDLNKIKIPLPPLPEQQRIVAKLDGLFADIDQAIGLLEENIAHTKALMGSVLDEEFGKLEAKGIKLKPISKFAKTKSGGTPIRGERQFWNGEIPWLKSGELNDSFKITENTEFITELGLQKSSASLFEKGTLLMAMYGATAGKLGILGMDACTNQAVCSIQNDKGLFDEIYIYFFLLSQRDRIIRESSGGAQPNISKGYIDKLEIPLPDIETQKALSKKFFEYQKAINSMVKLETQKMTHLKALKSSLLDQAFKGEL
ncbi:restriction endonuclease subunit S [Gelidibacter maritimus]|uniref:Restriction endonuclease subunit S n=1 Tax=Gelidibacter maritimus TaxID=2761487 RepID=A0A7W2R313_9FLAO|nr:restriction endonuclease subunit S [Gelidibacter maritimus]MBA6151510.1 restriction endonuclease subunit S [Gelidibacter maritimus]